MSGFNWACPTCGAATHSKEALVRSSEKSCSCDSALWVASDMPPCVGKLQEEIAALETSLAERWENLNVQDGVIDGLQEEIAALRESSDLLDKTARLLGNDLSEANNMLAIYASDASVLHSLIAALEKVAEAVALLFDDHELNDPWDVLEEALREAGYLKEEG